MPSVVCCFVGRFSELFSFSVEMQGDEGGAEQNPYFFFR